MSNNLKSKAYSFILLGSVTLLLVFFFGFPVAYFFFRVNVPIVMIPFAIITAMGASFIIKGVRLLFEKELIDKSIISDQKEFHFKNVINLFLVIASLVIILLIF